MVVRCVCACGDYVWGWPGEVLMVGVCHYVHCVCDSAARAICGCGGRRGRLLPALVLEQARFAEVCSVGAAATVGEGFGFVRRQMVSLLREEQKAIPNAVYLVGKNAYGGRVPGGLFCCMC